MKRRATWAIALAAVLALPLATGNGRAAAQSWPTQPVRIVVPAPAGSSLDLIARTLGERLAQRWKQPVVVDNKVGAGGLLGMDLVAKAAPDGHTLGIGFNGPIAFAPYLYRKLPYDPQRDLLPIVLTTSQPNVLAVAADNPAHTVGEFVTWARGQGDRLSYGSVGNGSASHLTMEWFKSAAGFRAVHVPYAGSPPAATSLAAGETQLLFAVEPALKPLIQGGRIRLLAATSLQRTDVLKDLPTLAESGYPGFEALAWNGLFAPAGTPPAVQAQINADVSDVLADTAVRDTFGRNGLVPGGGSAADFRRLIETEGQRWAPIIRATGITID